jgi:dTDP-4-dehydrorhamnose reductase
MLGHKLVQRLAARGLWVAAAIRSPAVPGTPAARAALACADQIFAGVDVLNDDQLAKVIAAAEPDLVANAVGVIKQLDAAKDPVAAIAVNALLPHRLASLCAKAGARLIHFSTDCVFSGRRGPYTEDSPPDAEDLYGRSKLLGEVTGRGCLTIRGSIIGRELRGGLGLIEWFMAQRGGRAAGYAGALYSGVTTTVMGDLVGELAVEFPDLDGLWHVASDAISKYDLLALVNHHYALGIALARDQSVVIDRRLDGGRFRARTGFSAPGWDAMIREMRADTTPYDMRPG